MKVVEGISLPLPALLPPALLPAPPQPRMPRDAGAGGTLLPGCGWQGWGDASMTQPHPTLKAAGDAWGQQVQGEKEGFGAS